MSLDCRIIQVNSASDLDNLEEYAEKTGQITLDIESNSLDAYRGCILLIQIGVETDTDILAYVIPARIINDDDVYCPIKRLIENPNIVKIGHNIGFDYKFINYLLGLEITNIYDTQIAEACITLGKQQKTSLQDVVKRRLGITVDKDIRKNFAGRKIDTVFTDQEIYYAGMDVVYLFPVWKSQQQDIKKLKLHKAVDLENHVVPITATMELNGVLIDLDRWGTLTEEYERRELSILNEIYELVGQKRPVQQSFFEDNQTKIQTLVTALNINNPAQAKKYLNLAGINVEDTSKLTLAKLKGQHELVDLLLQYRKVSKLNNSFLKPIPKMQHPVTKRWHPSYIQLPVFSNDEFGGASSGRYSSKDFNAQQLPQSNSVRHCFIARENHSIVTADYASVEVRIAANFSRDDTLIGFFHGDFHDFHGWAASKIFDLPIEQTSKRLELINGELVEIDPPQKDKREIAKRTTFALFYGASAHGLAHKVGLDLSVAEEVVERYYVTFPKLMSKLDAFAEYAAQTGTIRDAIGRIKFFDLPDKYSNEYFRIINRIKRQAKNYPIQATNASQIKYSLYLIWKHLRQYGVNILATIHDEIVCEVPNDIAQDMGNEITKLMIKAASIILPGPVGYEASCKILPHWTK